MCCTNELSELSGVLTGLEEYAHAGTPNSPTGILLVPSEVDQAIRNISLYLDSLSNDTH